MSQNEEDCGCCNYSLTVEDAYDKGYGSLSVDEYARSSMPSSIYCKLNRDYKPAKYSCDSWKLGNWIKDR
jgi:hypothetical protein